MIDYPTLGWRVLDWMSAYLPSPADSDDELTLTDEQALIVLQWYALDEDGEFLHRRGRLEMAKGWGKSPLLAAIGLAEFVGPVCFAGWDAAGEPIGKPWERPIVEIAAVSEDQTDNTYSALHEMLTANDGRAAKALKIDVGLTRLHIIGRPGVLRPVTAAHGSREGARLTFAVLDETHLWTRTNGGTKLANTLRRNAAKMGGRTFETTNAPVLGEKSVAEESGMDAEPGVLHVARRPEIEPSLDWPEQDLRKALVHVYGDSTWAPIDRLLLEIADPATSWDDALRFYFNVRTAGVARAVDPRHWDSLGPPARPVRDVPDGTLIGLGFDGSDYRDPTTLRACTTDGYSWPLGTWRPTHDKPVPRGEVMATIRNAFARFRVGLMLADPPRWRDEIDELALEFGEEVVLAFDTNQARRMAPAVDRWLTAVRGGTHTHDGDEFTSDQVKATRLKKVRLADVEDDRTMYLLEKDGRIGNDSTVADVLAYEAAMTMTAPVDAPKPFAVWASA